MIDAVVGSDGALVIVHDERRLDGATEALLRVPGGELALRGPGGRHEIGRLLPSMVDALNPSLTAYCARMNGFSLARSDAIRVVVEHGPGAPPGGADGESAGG